MRGDGDESGHYRGDIEPIDVIIDMGDGPAFCRGNIIKYVKRYKEKGGRVDLFKARDYIDTLIRLEYPSHESVEVEVERLKHCGGLNVPVFKNEKTAIDRLISNSKKVDIVES